MREAVLSVVPRSSKLSLVKELKEQANQNKSNVIAIVDEMK